MDCAATCSAYVRDGRGEAAARKAPAGKTGFAGSDAVWCGRLSHGSYRSLWSGKPHAAQGAAVQAVSCGWTGKRRPAHAWRNGYCRMGRSSRRALSSRRRLPLAERLGRYFDFSCTDGGGPWPQEGRMPGMTEICVFLAWIAGGFVSGVSGIGGAMVAFPFLAMLLPVHEAIALTCIVNMVMDICLASLHFRFCRVSALWPMLLASVPGSFAGLYILQICSGPVLQGAVGLLLLYYVYWQKTFRARGTIAHPRALGAVAGFGSGLLGTAIAFDGPPVGAYGLCMGWEPRVLLGTLGVFFVLRATVTLVLQGMAGFYTPTVLTCAMYGAPGVILGTCIAFPVVKHISQQAFRKVLLCVIAVAGLVCLVRALG